jgi:asparagine synthase (glutamine-hydrolysing)
MKVFGARPSFQTEITALHRLRRQLNFVHIGRSARYRFTYPYLDRDLLEFLVAIPREQLVRPGQRRSLMRRALAGIVPAEILARKRKAFVARRPLVLLATNRIPIERLLHEPLLAACGWIDPESFKVILASACNGESQHATFLSVALRLELWTRMLVGQRRIAVPLKAEASKREGSSSPGLYRCTHEPFEIQSARIECK